jgi:ubiquinone/menaquinone biosynthesis C-methylase UbiE
VAVECGPDFRNRHLPTGAVLGRSTSRSCSRSASNIMTRAAPARAAVVSWQTGVVQTAAFATDRATGAYYEQRAGEYDEWYTGEGLFASRDRPGWHDELAQVVELVGSLSPARTLDVACGTGFLTQHLQGCVVGLDQSPAMVALARSRLPTNLAVIGDALHLSFADGAFDRVFTGHFYGHLPPAEREAFLSEAARVANELVVVDSALRPGADPEQFQERVLNDGSGHRVYKRYFATGELADELGGEALFDGTWFVAARVQGSHDRTSSASFPRHLG